VNFAVEAVCSHLLAWVQPTFWRSSETKSPETTSSVMTLNVVSFAGPKLVDDNNTADTRAVVPGVKSKPPPPEEHLEPSAEIHRGGVRRYADISKVAGAISSGDIHAATQSHSEVCEIATHSNPLTIRIERRSVVTRVRISKFDVAMDEVTDRLNPLPPGL
jgi:hypothetical protein